MFQITMKSWRSIVHFQSHVLRIRVWKRLLMSGLKKWKPRWWISWRGSETHSLANSDWVPITSRWSKIPVRVLTISILCKTRKQSNASTAVNVVINTSITWFCCWYASCPKREGTSTRWMWLDVPRSAVSVAMNEGLGWWIGKWGQ